MAALTVQNIVDAGTAPTFVAASTSDTAPRGNGRNTFLVYKNADSSGHTVTVVAPGNTEYGQANPDPQISLAATNGERWIPLRKEYDDGTGNVTVTLDDATGVTVACVRVDW